jgi:iron complex transport system substrate-binding protein
MKLTRTQQPRAALGALLAIGLTITACGGDDSDQTASPPSSAATSAVVDNAAFPVTVPHAFGETVVEAEPERVVAWGWGSADAAIAMDVVPVAMAFQGYGGDAEGVLPWAREAIEAAGAPMPTILPDVPGGESPPFEAIAAANPDLILAVYSGITAEDYELLSEIAPTIAYPDAAWSTEWREVIEIVGTSLGRPDAAAAVLADIDAQIDTAAAEHPEFAGVSVAQVWDTGDTFYVYEPADARVAFTQDLGFTVAPSVEALGTDESTFYFTLSYERLAELESDLLIAYADTADDMDRFLTSPPAQLMGQVTAGRVAPVIGTEFIASVSPPTALSLTWGLDEYVSILADALASSEGAAAPTTTDSDMSAASDAAAAAAAWSVVFDSATAADDKEPHLADAAALQTTIEAYAAAGSVMGGIQLTPTNTVIDGDTATVTYDVLFAGNPAYQDQTGTLSLVDGVWVVSREEFCAFMASARTPCP